MQLLGHAGLRRIFAHHGESRAADEDEDDDGETYGTGRRQTKRSKRAKYPYPAVPSGEGTRLMRSGTFGCTDCYQDALRRRNKKLARRLLSRELGVECDHMCTQDRAISQVRYLKPKFPWKLAIYVQHFRVLYPHLKRTPSSIITLAATQVSSRMMAISSSPVPRTSKSACTTRRTHTNGDITRLSHTLLDNGPLPMLRSARIIDTSRTARYVVPCVSRPLILEKVVNHGYLISRI